MILQCTLVITFVFANATLVNLTTVNPLNVRDQITSKTKRFRAISTFMSVLFQMFYQVTLLQESSLTMITFHVLIYFLFWWSFDIQRSRFSFETIYKKNRRFLLSVILVIRSFQGSRFVAFVVFEFQWRQMSGFNVHAQWIGYSKTYKRSISLLLVSIILRNNFVIFYSLRPMRNL